MRTLPNEANAGLHIANPDKPFVENFTRFGIQPAMISASLSTGTSEPLSSEAPTGHLSMLCPTTTIENYSM